MYTLLVLFSAIALCNALSGQVELWKLNNQALTLNIDPSKGTVNIVLTGDSTQWIGVGFNGTDMNNTYAFVADYDSDVIYELKLGSGLCSPQCDKQLTKRFTVNSNTVSNGVRTVNITRPINDNAGSDYYTFPTTAGKINIIWAFGLKGQQFLNGTDMQNQGPTTITLS
eukprot:CAMPEP_0197021312 /NCGR_PEP_ID=MMETSP1384-20130603/2188_1 /TAXON_ID=29189 /ORGANISM="Ammonia sp." /LENGTH=168 /DNA_ID=CAMNT_0042449109 /DNA_START=67 /DNA_END=573 /DNA_ORIENTATION=+